jgi:hypothetical protein
MTDTNGTPATWHGVPRPEGLSQPDPYRDLTAGMVRVPNPDEAEDYTDEDAADFRADPCAVCGDTTVCTSQAGERLCAEHGAREVRDGIPPDWDEDAPQWAEDGQLGPDGIDQAQAREDAAVSRWESRQTTGPSLPGVWTPAELRAVVLTAGEIADAYGTGVDGLDGSDILSTRQRELLERAAQAFRVEGAEDEPAPADHLVTIEHAMACCTSAIGPVCRHRTTPVADALQEVDHWQAKGVLISHPSGEGEIAALRKLADAVRSHGIGADLAAKRGD